MLDHFGRTLERRYLANACNGSPIRPHSELKITIRVETLGVDGELCNLSFPRVSQRLHGPDAQSCRAVAGDLLEPKHHELGGLERRKAEDDGHDSQLMSIGAGKAGTFPALP